MNIAIVGCGQIADIHAKSLRALGYTISLVIDKNINNAKGFAEKWNVANYSELLSDDLISNLDSIHICTPPTAHYDIVKKCLDFNKHVVCEKPLCLSKDESKTLMLLAKEKNLVNAVNFNVRYYDACQKAQEIIKQDKFGRPLIIQCSYQQEFHALPEAYSWRYRPEVAGHLRATTEIGSHCIDLIRFWTGLKITSVSANFGCFNPVRHISDGIMYQEEKEGSTLITISSEDAVVISLKFSNGAIGNILLSEVSHGRNNNIKLEVTGDNQSVWWGSETPYHLNTAQKGAGINTSINAFSQNFSDTVALFIEQVYEDIESNSHHNNYPDFSDGYINSLICDAIYKSAKNNADWVQVEE